MAQVIVRNIEDAIKVGLEARASKHGWSMEEEVRQILRRAVGVEGSAQSKLGSRIAARFADVGLTEPLPSNIAQAKIIVMFEEPIGNVHKPDIVALARAARASFPKGDLQQLHATFDEIRSEWDGRGYDK